MQDQQEAFLFWSCVYDLPTLHVAPPGYEPVPQAVIENLDYRQPMIDVKEDE